MPIHKAIWLRTYQLARHPTKDPILFGEATIRGVKKPGRGQGSNDSIFNEGVLGARGELF